MSTTQSREAGVKLHTRRNLAEFRMTHDRTGLRKVARGCSPQNEGRARGSARVDGAGPFRLSQRYASTTFIQIHFNIHLSLITEPRFFSIFFHQSPDFAGEDTQFGRAGDATPDGQPAADGRHKRATPARPVPPLSPLARSKGARSWSKHGLKIQKSNYVLKVNTHDEEITFFSE